MPTATQIVDNGGAAQTSECHAEVELGVFGVVGDHEHAVDAVEDLFQRPRLDTKLADDLRCHEKIVADGRHRRGAQHVEHRHDGRAPHVVRRRPALVGEAEQCDTRTVETTARLG